MEQKTADPFGEVLRSFRKRRRLSQQALADLLGVHRNTISIWERGDFLPESKTIMLELARQLHLNDQETRILLEASLTAITPYWYVPFQRNSFFTGREEVLKALHSQLGGEQAVALTQSSALHGLGGVGKTQIALEYAYRHALEYTAVFWIGAETEESIAASLVHIAETLQLLKPADQDQQSAITAVQRWLSTHRQWLLIWDNVEDLNLLNRFLPSTRSGALLMTTRRQVLGVHARGIELPSMAQEEGILFLLRRAKVLASDATQAQMRQFAGQMPAQYMAAADLMAVLGGLPLALDQAGAYLEATRCGLSAYLDLFLARRMTLLQQRGEGVYDHPASVSTTFTLALMGTVERHSAVGDLLRVCALLQPDTIPEALFVQGGEHLGGPLQEVCRDPLEWNRVLALACSYSLLSRQPAEQTLAMHRLVQAVLLDTMTDEEQEQWTRRIILTFEKMLPDKHYSAWKLGEQLLPHALLCLRRVGKAEESLPFASFTFKMAQYLYNRGRYSEAEPLYQRALHIRERLLGPEHPEIASSLNYLAILYWRQGRYGEAELLYQQALRIWELEPGQPDARKALSNLAILYTAQGRYGEAEQLYQQMLRIRELHWGPDQNEWTAQLFNNLAFFYMEQRRYKEAEPFQRQALQIWELQVLGPDHPDIALPLSNLATIYSELGRYGEAEELYERALHIREQHWGPDHIEVADSLNDWANLLREQGRYGEAEQFYQRAYAIREQQLGPRHPEVAQTLYDMAILWQKQGDLSLAVSLVERSLSIRLHALGDAHPKTLATRKLSAQLFQEQAEVARGIASAQAEKMLADWYCEHTLSRTGRIPGEEDDQVALPISPAESWDF